MHSVGLGTVSRVDIGLKGFDDKLCVRFIVAPAVLPVYKWRKFVNPFGSAVVDAYHDAARVAFLSRAAMLSSIPHSPAKEVTESNKFCPSCMYSTGYRFVKAVS